MDSRGKYFDTPNGRVTICGPLELYEDLSYRDLKSGVSQEYESGVLLSSFSRPSPDTISRQFKLLNDLFFQDKYMKISTGSTNDLMPFNRYIDILAYERNAVKLPEFINASYISGVFDPEQRRKFIATQGPLPVTIQAFWKMVWVNGVRSIFMLCGMQECQVGKCQIYWPNVNSAVVIGDLRIKNVEENNRNGFVWRKFEVTCAGEVRIVTHYHYIAWPDHGVPRELGTLAGFLNELIQEEHKEGPIIVHCSAGVGRTGTLIALSHLKQTIEAQKNLRLDLGISVFSVVRRLREQRNLMVQSKEQYDLLYNFVNEWLR
ncbi:hypothetical protein SteCoe_27894 [Stentor coeruleus]|uniref:Protein-tyrosine-phosphatase n=1 Tax=Stentor coeruleus TaxID=5963 RepID=A0A1R2B9H1_9CILI|nr:hypothetical protein SteCoe_27894 [Stentor coeruleus]